MSDRILGRDELNDIADALYVKVTPTQAQQIAKLFTSHFFLEERVKQLEAVVRKQAIRGLDELQRKILHG